MGVFVFCFFFSNFREYAWNFRTQATQQRTRARAEDSRFENVDQSLLLLRNEREAEQFIFDRSAVCRVSNTHELPHEYTQLTASVSFGTLADAHWTHTHTHTHFYTERERERKKVRDYRIRSHNNIKLDYISFNQVSLFCRAVTFSI